MTRAVALSTAIGLALAAASCSSARPPEELTGLWSTGPASCSAGLGVRFRADAIEAVYDRQVETLFERPRYEVMAQGEDFRVRITYELPKLAGGAQVAGAHGVIVLARQPGGRIAPSAHALIDARTGAARVPIAGDPAVRVLSLEPCGAHPWREVLRGRA
ncbi:MAG: hypothetical protein AB7Q23_05735 [Hyphomonadaceae bacterium]